jgi:AAA domain
MKRVASEFWRYEKYIEKAKEWMWNQNNLQKVRVKWELITDTNLLARLKEERLFADPAAPIPGPEAVWLSISELDDSPEFDLVDRFCDSPTVMERTEQGLQFIGVLDSNPNQGCLLLERRPTAKDRVLILRPNDSSLERQKRAFRKLRDEPEPEHRPLLRLAEDSSLATWPSVEIVVIDSWEFLTNEEIPGTDEQRIFVRKALGTPDFAILEGPPGSGKTTTICEIIIQEIRRGHRVLLCASTHVAVDNVLEELQDHGATDRDVIAVRIGDRMKLSQKTRKFQLEVREDSERKDLIQKLRSVKNPTPSQQYFLKSLETSGNEDPELITRIVLQCANLVCGTMIGILKHPDIKKQTDTKNRGALDIYDCLIVDEASKTTFQEFLVPGVFAKRWILVGDVNQLSPYVETRDLEGNIQALIRNSDDANVCVDVFQSFEDSRQLSTTRGLVIHESRFANEYLQQSQALGLQVCKISPTRESEPSPLEVLGSHVVIIEGGGNSLQGYQDLIPQDAEIVTKEEIPDTLRRRHEHWLAHFGRNLRPPSQEQTGSEKWAREIAWRLDRAFQKRKEGSEIYKEQISHLIPKWYDPSSSQEISDSLDLIKRVALPSVLELLQKGFEKGKAAFTASTLTDGLGSDSLSERFTRLRYQHRMHSQISKFPREQFYAKESLVDSPGIDDERQWSYSRYSDRAGWIQVAGQTVGGRNVNPTEADLLIRELDAFLEWAKSNPTKRGRKGENEPWSVAVLTFYRAQEGELRTRLRSMLRSGARTNFVDSKSQTRIDLHTVDRFQGHEADIVFLSFVRRSGFFDSPNRLNVALTRARYQLVLIGNRVGYQRHSKSDVIRDLANMLPMLRISF